MKELKNKRTMESFILLLSIFLLFILDIFTKYYFTNKKYFEGNLIYINSTTNTGSAFSIFSNISYYNLIVGLLGLLFVFLIIYYFYYSKYKVEFNNLYLKLTFILIISGVLGNTYDRFIFGFTRDFIGLGNLFIFNIADFYLTLAVITYIYYELKEFKKISN